MNEKDKLTYVVVCFLIFIPNSSNAIHKENFITCFLIHLEQMHFYY